MWALLLGAGIASGVWSAWIVERRHDQRGWILAVGATALLIASLILNN